MLRLIASVAFIALARAQGGLVDHPIAGDSLTYLDSQEWQASTPGLAAIRATVPGDLITDLQVAGLIGDPLYELNWLNSSIWDARVWTFTRSFSLAPAALAALAAGAGDTLLVFDGIKMSATISLNGAVIGHTTNQFLRYTYSLAAAAAAGARLGAVNTLAVAFDSADQTTEGRWMACTGGWDWAPYTNTKSMGAGASGPTPARTFSKGLWKSVYLVGVGSAAITHLVPHPIYQGAYPVAPLTDDSNGGFLVRVRVHMWAPAAGAAGTLTVRGAWPGALATQALELPAGDSNVTLTLAAPAGSVRLWWPIRLGAQPLYAVNASFAPASGPAPAAERHVGFRYVVYSTGNDTNADWVKANTGGDGNADPQGLLVRANGAPVHIFGANMIPIDELEGRYSAVALERLVVSASDSMNMLRVWGGGIYQSPAFYDACDRLGVMVLHDMQFAQDGHSPVDGSASQRAEFQHQMRRLSHHPSIVAIDGCNECHVILNTSTGVYATFVMQTVVEEDMSRIVWPSCPSNGWAAGVDRLSAHPNGSPLGLLPNARPPAAGAACQFKNDTDVDGDGPADTPGASADDCCAQCAAMQPSCASVVYFSGRCYPKFDGGAPVPKAGRQMCAPTNHIVHNTIELHGPYQHGSGWPAVNGGGTSDLNLFPSGYPLTLDAATPLGLIYPSQFASEFGASVMSSFESMAPTLAPAHWGIQGGGPPDTCGSGFETICNGTNVMAQRNYPESNYLVVYFNTPLDSMALVGEAAFKSQLYQGMVAQALNVAMKISQKRVGNTFGTMIWQLGEIWPTGGWGSIEYATAAWTPGQVLGGRWKPLHYWYKSALFTPVFATCGRGGVCLVKNDNHLPLAGATLTVSKVALATGAATAVYSDAALALPAGPGAGRFFTIDASIDGSAFVLRATVTAADATVLTDNWVPLLPPANWTALPRSAHVTFAVAPAPSADGSVDIAVSTDALAAYVVLTTLAQGRFSDNAFFALPGAPRTVRYIPFGETDYDVLITSLRVEHAAQYMA